METTEFWKLLEMHPYLLHVIDLNESIEPPYDYRNNSRKQFKWIKENVINAPLSLGQELLDAIERTVSIAFVNDLSGLNLDEADSIVEDEERSESETITKGVAYRVYWHLRPKPGEYAPGRQPQENKPFGRFSRLGIPDGTIKQAIRELRRNTSVVIDAVLKKKYVDRNISTAKDREDPPAIALLRTLIHGPHPNSDSFESYEIFLFPPNWQD